MKARKILVFNPFKKLIAVFQSTTAAAQVFHTSPTSIHYACTGKTISASNFYFRHLKDNIEITLEDFGQLKIQEYDDLCEVKRKYHPNKNMGK